MALQGAARLPDLEQVLERIDRAVDDLDATITEIRTAIFELNETTLPDGLRRGVLDLTQELTSFLGFRPEVRFSGVIDTAVSQRTADHALAVVRESLMNVGKHAGATHVTVSLTVVDDFCLEISDNGSGLKTSDAVGTGRGLVNLQRRAEALHGSFELRRRDESGTDVVWRVPLANG
jgi:signal transduction histidine kinase